MSTLALAEAPRVGMRERLLLLRSLSTLASLDDDALGMLAEHARYRIFRKGELLSRADAPPTAVHIIIDGRVAVTAPLAVAQGAGAESAPLFVAREGDGLGVLPVIAGAPGARATAEATTRVLEIPGAAFMAALEDNFSLLRNELRLLAVSALSAHGMLPASPPKSLLGMGTEVYPARPLTVVERVMRLRQGPFGVMSVDALTEFARRMSERRIPAGEPIWSAGELPDYTLHLHYGRVLCTAVDGGTMEVGPPIMLGEMDAWAGRQRSYAASAITDVVAWRVSLEDVLMVLESHIQPAIEMLAAAARNLLAEPGSCAIALGAHRAEQKQ